MTFLAICAILKNEGRYVYEWLSYHHYIGVERFLLFDNGSTDDMAAVIRSWPRANCVTLVDWPHLPGQLSAYTQAVMAYRDFARWCAFIDGDEFLVAQSDLSVPDVLHYFDPICTGLYVHWLMFGSSGLRERQNGFVTQTFRRRARADFGPNTFGKTVVKMRHVTDVGIHLIRSDGCLINDAEDIIDQTKAGLHSTASHRYIALNHYYTKSLAEWNLRRSSGKADKSPDAPDYRRSSEEFNRHDVNDVEDNRAAEIMQRAAPRYWPPDQLLTSTPRG
jgi:hypothetical protein